MKNKKSRYILISILMAVILMMNIGCAKSKSNYTLITDNFKGIGFEWDTYDNPTSVDLDTKNFLESAADTIAPSAIRIMLDIDKYCESFEDNITPKYNFESDSMKNLYDILDYCKNKGVSVTIGLWHTRESGFVYDAIPDEGQPLYAKVLVDLLVELINVREYSCIKYVVPMNEPNYTSRYRNGEYVAPYKLWSECMNNLVLEMEERSFISDVTIAGPDISTLTEISIWMKKVERDYSNKLGIYEMHAYPSSSLVSSGNLLKRIRASINELTAKKDLWLYETGIVDGKTENDSQGNIRDYSYGVETADLAISSIMGGVDGVMFWSFDKKMHQKNGMDADWGLVDSSIKSFRPWFYSTALLSNALKEGSSIRTVVEEDDFRGIFSSNDQSYFLAVNRGNIDKTIVVKENASKKSDKLYVYNFTQDDFNAEDGSFSPDAEISSNFKAGATITVKAGSFIVVSTEKI